MKSSLKLLVIDVDGTLTDSGIYYDDCNNEVKKFCTRDSAGFFAAHAAGIRIMILTGRTCQATARRMSEMKVDYLVQGVVNKAIYLQEFILEHDLAKEEIGYIGDDVNDLAAMRLVGFVSCPADSCPEVIAVANYVCHVNGGNGVVRETVEYLLRPLGIWESVISQIYG